MPIRSFEQVSPAIDPTAWIDDSAVVIGDVEIGADSSVWPQCVLRGDVNRIQVGCRSSIQDGCVVHVSHRSGFNPSGNETVVGDEVTIGHLVVLHGCTVEDRCLVGSGSILLDGCRVQSGAMIAAGSLVTPGTVVEGGYLWLGRPARRLRPLTEEEMERLEYSARHYVKLKNRYSPDG
jgi:carbonic anhydrase/acetyltransferase-like protein (isoleucine patch superfamily)